MSIRMIVLHDAHDGNEFRVAAHTIHTYFATPWCTKVNAILDVKETVEQIDAFFDIDRRPLPANEQFEVEEGVLHT